MPILDMDMDTCRYTEDGASFFAVRCDCVGQSSRPCAGLEFSAGWWGGDECDLYEVNVTLYPAEYPYDWRRRLWLAWEILWHGKFRYRDDMMIDKATLEGWASRLAKLAERMKDAHQ
jgi:hypothetical protein